MSSSKVKNWLSGTQWVAHRRMLLESTAWKARPLALVRILERLEIEHMRHAGAYNALYVSYSQLVAHGVSRKTIQRALRLGEDLGLLKVVQKTGLYGGPLRPPNEYLLTYLSHNGKPPSDEWKKVTAQIATAALKRYRK